ncbi:MAG: hypothetical protein KME31_02085 [Tolypothrix carrinoi HA7290-LM1]|jgi:hypothetical protein|nr:hypothetical protein [Tolypothrix carrinoi HA7290-LM1]
MAILTFTELEVVTKRFRVKKKLEINLAEILLKLTQKSFEVAVIHELPLRQISFFRQCKPKS